MLFRRRSLLFSITTYALLKVASQTNVTIGLLCGFDEEDTGVLRYVYDTAIDDINKNQVIPNVMVHKQVKNSHYRAAQGVKNMISVMSQQNQTTHPLIGVVGDKWSSLTSALAFVTNAWNVLQCSYSATAPLLSNKANYGSLYRTAVSDIYQGKAVAAYVKSMGWEKVGILSENSKYGTELGQQFEYSAGELGIEVLLRVSYTYKGDDYAKAAAMFKDAGVKIVICFTYDDVLTYMREARKLGMIGKNYAYIGGDGTIGLDRSAQSTPHSAGDLENIEGFVFFSQADGDVTSPTHTSLVERFNQKFPDSDAETSLVSASYDCVLSIAHAFAHYLQTSGTTAEQFVSNNLEMVDQKPTLGNVANLTYLGANGPFQIDEQGDPVSTMFNAINLQTSDLKRVKLARINGRSAEVEILDTPYFHSGSTTIPSDMPPEQKISYAQPGVLFAFIFYMANVLLCIVSMGGLIYFRNKRTIRGLSLPFLLLINFGLILVWLTPLSFIGPLNNVMCIVQNSILWIAFGIIFSALIAKVGRIWVIYDNIRTQGTNLSNSRLLLYSGVIILGELIILGTWFGIDPPTPQKKVKSEYFYYRCVSNDVFIEDSCNVALLTYNGILLFVTNVLAYKTRNVSSEFHESTWISHVSGTLFVEGIGGILVTYLAPHSLLDGFYVKMVVVAFSGVFAYICLIGRLFVRIFSIERTKEKADNFEFQKEELQKRSSVTTGSSNGTNSVTVASSSADRNSKFSLFVLIKKLKGVSQWRQSRILIFSHFMLIFKWSPDDKYLSSSGQGFDIGEIILDEMEGTSNIKIETKTEGFIVQLEKAEEKVALVNRLKQILGTLEVPAVQEVIQEADEDGEV